MTKPFVLLAAASALSSPALAGNPYVAVEGGYAVGRSNDVDETVEYSTTPSRVFYDDVFGIQYKHGVDLGLVAGYDFGWLRLEGELAHKRVGLKRNVEDDITSEFLRDLNSALNRPSVAPDPGAPGRPALTIDDFQPSGSLKVGSAMVNALLEAGVADGFTISGGGGLGRSFARGLGDNDGARAWQYMVGARYAVSRRVDVGLKYRYFNSGIIKLTDDPVAFSGNPDQLPLGGTQTTDAAVTPNIEGKFRTRSLLASVTYNFR